MPAETFSKPLEGMLNGKCSYEYYHQATGTYSKTQKTRICHVTLNAGENYNKNVVLMVFTIRNQSGKWKIHSEGIKRTDPGATVPLRNKAIALAKANGWKYASIAVAGEDTPATEVVSKYVVSMESYGYGHETVYDLSNELEKLNELGLPNFYRCEAEVNGNTYSFAFIKKDFLVDYLSVIDNRAYRDGGNLLVIADAVDEDLTVEKLGAILADMYNGAAAGNQSNAIRMFGVKYGKIISQKGYAATAIAKASGIDTTSYSSEVSKGICIYKSIKDNEYGIRFYEDDVAADDNGTQDAPAFLPRVHKDHPLNCILYGAPGTGKTYATAEYALAIMENRAVDETPKTPEQRKVVMEQYRAYVNNNRIVFTTFHQSYGYEDFVQGLRPITDVAGIQFKTVDGVFKRIADAALKDPQNNYVIIIDEINRANISKVFGELITLIEDDKRWGEVNALQVTLPSGDPFKIPNNLYIVGTMNSADKSISLIDTALRRRFEFIEVTPDATLIADPVLRSVLEKLNASLAKELDSTDLLVGHAYFIGKAEDDLCSIFNRSIIPLLYEYFYDNSTKVKTQIKNALPSDQYEITGGTVGRVKISKK